MSVATLEQARQAVVIVKGRRVTRDDILEVLALCDRMGKGAFLEAHGYREAHRYHLRHDGRSYPSKAILGVAAGLESSEFFGGAASTVSRLARLGFYVRDSLTGDVVDEIGLESLRRTVIAAGFDDPAPAWPELPVTPASYFASGSNRAAEIAALGKLGADVGVAAPLVRKDAEAELIRLAGSDVQVFVDSGAFSEVRFNPARGAFDVARAITHREWRERLALYQRLSESLHEQAWVVAPDRVGSQELTLERLERYRGQLDAIARTGARILIVAQKGAMSQAAFFRRALEASGLEGYKGALPALPCKKAATTAEETTDFVRALEPAHVHLLGLGVRNRKAVAYTRVFASPGVEASYSMDSCWIAGNVGRNGGKRRRFTKAQDIAAGVLESLGRLTVRLKVELALFACLAGPAAMATTSDGQGLLF